MSDSLEPNNLNDTKKKSGVRPIPKTSRVIAFLIGMNLMIVFAPRIGLIHEFAYVNPSLSFFALIAGIGLLLWAISNMFYIPGQKE